MTLDEASIGLAGVFENGQTYVAVSRVGPRHGLHLQHELRPQMVKIDKQASASICMHTSMVLGKRGGTGRAIEWTKGGLSDMSGSSTEAGQVSAWYHNFTSVTRLRSQVLQRMNVERAR